MTEHEIIAEMHIVSGNIERLSDRLNELKHMLYERDEFKEYLKKRTLEDCQDETEDEPKAENSAVKDRLFDMMRTAKDRNGKGLNHSTIVNRLTKDEKAVMDKLIENRTVLKVRIGTNYYYKEAN